METILGIDLGTTNSVVSIIRDGDVSVLEEEGQKILPSVVGLDPEGSSLPSSRRVSALACSRLTPASVSTWSPLKA